MARGPARPFRDRFSFAASAALWRRKQLLQLAAAWLQLEHFEKSLNSTATESPCPSRDRHRDGVARPTLDLTTSRGVAAEIRRSGRPGSIGLPTAALSIPVRLFSIGKRGAALSATRSASSGARNPPPAPPGRQPPAVRRSREHQGMMWMLYAVELAESRMLAGQLSGV